MLLLLLEKKRFSPICLIAWNVDLHLYFINFKFLLWQRDKKISCVGISFQISYLSFFRCFSFFLSFFLVGPQGMVVASKLGVPCNFSLGLHVDSNFAAEHYHHHHRGSMTKVILGSVSILITINFLQMILRT